MARNLDLKARLDTIKQLEGMLAATAPERELLEFWQQNQGVETIYVKETAMSKTPIVTKIEFTNDKARQKFIELDIGQDVNHYCKNIFEPTDNEIAYYFHDHCFDPLKEAILKYKLDTKQPFRRPTFLDQRLWDYSKKVINDAKRILGIE